MYQPHTMDDARLRSTGKMVTDETTKAVRGTLVIQTVSCHGWQHSNPMSLFKIAVHMF
jgi:hypothetical protein